MGSVLVVDDDTETRDVIALRFVTAGHSARFAAGGAEALDLIALDGMPDVAVLDVCMPGMDGVELYERMLAEHGPACCPALFLSAAAGIDRVARAVALGAGFIDKPFRLRDVVTAVEARLPAR